MYCALNTFLKPLYFHSSIGVIYALRRSQWSNVRKEKSKLHSDSLATERNSAKQDIAELHNPVFCCLPQTLPLLYLVIFFCK